MNKYTNEGDDQRLNNKYCLWCYNYRCCLCSGPGRRANVRMIRMIDRAGNNCCCCGHSCREVEDRGYGHITTTRGRRLAPQPGAVLVVFFCGRIFFGWDCVMLCSFVLGTGCASQLGALGGPLVELIYE